MQALTAEQRQITQSTISTQAFYYVVLDHLLKHEGLSVVRMGDGERTLLTAYKMLKSSEPSRLADPVSSEDGAWRKRLGVEGISYAEVYSRLLIAGNESKFFAPNINGLVNSPFSVHEFFTWRELYVDNFFVNVWSNESLVELYKQAGHVVFLHASRGLADAFQIRLKRKLGVKLTYFELNSWHQSADIIERVSQVDAPLVLFSGGPALKYMAVDFERQGKVALDIGNTADRWSLPYLQD